MFVERIILLIPPNTNILSITKLAFFERHRSPSSAEESFFSDARHFLISEGGQDLEEAKP